MIYIETVNDTCRYVPNVAYFISITPLRLQAEMRIRERMVRSQVTQTSANTGLRDDEQRRMA